MQAQTLREDKMTGEVNISKKVLVIALIDLNCYMLRVNT